MRASPKKQLGQHWLNDIQSLESMITAGEVMRHDTVLEIGAGPGMLTELLVKRAREVVAVELDLDLAANLPHYIKSEHLTVIQGDILRYDLNQLPKDYKVVANIPYYLTSKLLRALLEAENPPSLIALLVQKEVAERIAAAPGDMSTSSVSAQFYADVELKETVPAEVFIPPPKVDSQIVQLRLRDKPLFDVDTKKFFQVVKAGFSERRKKLVNALAGGLDIEKERAAELIKETQLAENVRAQELSLDDWRRLYEIIDI